MNIYTRKIYILWPKQRGGVRSVEPKKLTGDNATKSVLWQFLV